jgi:hypothetical protein
MNGYARKSNHRSGQVLVRAIVLIVCVAACILSYRLYPVELFEALFVPTALFGLLIGGVVIHKRARARDQWQAAWDAYARRDASSESLDVTEENRAALLAASG